MSQVVWVEILTKTTLFAGDTEQDVLFKICSVLGPPPAEWHSGHEKIKVSPVCREHGQMVNAAHYVQNPLTLRAALP